MLVSKNIALDVIKLSISFDKVVNSFLYSDFWLPSEEFLRMIYIDSAFRDIC